jgi:hypothetical protein
MIMVKKLKIIILFSIFYFLFSASVVSAAILYLEPAAGQYHQGDTFIVEVRLDTEGEYINAVETNLNFPSDILEVRDLSSGNSVLTLWIKNPSFSGDVISFVGGIPAGYQGPDGLIGKIVFQVQEKAQDSAKIIFRESSVLLNDGQGTKAKLSFKGAVFSISPLELKIPKDQWTKELEGDKIPPLPFKVEISKDPAIFEGKYFIFFSTTDKETGIDHYEIKEGKREWKTGISPYVLKNQRLTDDIWVKAIDKAGNEWIEIVKAPKEPVWKYILWGVLALILILAIIKIREKLRKL